MSGTSGKMSAAANDWEGRFAIDQLLRKSGFEIASREGRKMALWYRRYMDVNGKPCFYELDRKGERRLYTQRDALNQLSQVDVDQAAARHRRYLEAKYS